MSFLLYIMLLLNHTLGRITVMMVSTSPDELLHTSVASGGIAAFRYLLPRLTTGRPFVRSSEHIILYHLVYLVDHLLD